MLLDKISCPVLHHNTNPTWYEEIKIRLPLNITAHHHLLFSFVHVSCDLSKRRDANTTYENAVGYAWMPLLSKGKINVDEQVLPVAASLPAGYLAIQPLGLGKGVRMFFSFHLLIHTRNLSHIWHSRVKEVYSNRSQNLIYLTCFHSIY